MLDSELREILLSDELSTELLSEESLEDLDDDRDDSAVRVLDDELASCCVDKHDPSPLFSCLEPRSEVDLENELSDLASLSGHS